MSSDANWVEDFDNAGWGLRIGEIHVSDLVWVTRLGDKNIDVVKSPEHRRGGQDIPHKRNRRPQGNLEIGLEISGLRVSWHG